MSMYSKTDVLKKSSFIIHILNTVLWGRQRQTLNGHFSVINGNIFLIFNSNGSTDTRKRCFPRNNEKRSSIAGENRVFFLINITVTFSNLRHPQVSTLARRFVWQSPNTTYDLVYIF